jgi:curved DNA-binding protein CbpA
MSISVNDYIKYDLYNIFLLTRTNFSTALLRKAYQRQVLIYHPDKFEANISEEEKKEKYITFNLINNAYTILSNETLRKEYDSLKLKEELENTNFLDLKSQFKQQKNSFEKVTEFNVDKFKQQMEEMNKKIEEKIEDKSDKLPDLSVLELERNNNQQEILDYYKSHEEQYNLNLLKSEKIKPSNNFNSELSNISDVRNTKVENNGSELYNGLVNNNDNKYATLEDAFKLYN